MLIANTDAPSSAVCTEAWSLGFRSLSGILFPSKNSWVRPSKRIFIGFWPKTRNVNLSSTRSTSSILPPTAVLLPAGRGGIGVRLSAELLVSIADLSTAPDIVWVFDVRAQFTATTPKITPFRNRLIQDAPVPSVY